MFDVDGVASSAQLSLLDVNGTPRIYCCESTKVNDLAGNNHVLCAGIDLNPALLAQGVDADAMASELKQLCINSVGGARVPKAIQTSLTSVANILNINWVARSLQKPAQLICARGNSCPRSPQCYNCTNN